MEFNNKISPEISNILKFIACLIIALHHYAQWGIDNNLLSGPIYSALRSVGGDLSVTIFFFLSGYGLMSSNLSKPLTFIQFIKKRFSRLLVPFWIANVIFVSLYWIFGVSNISTRSIPEAIFSVIGVVMYDGSEWFVYVLMLFYLLFIISNHFKWQLTILSVLTLLFISVSIACGSQSFLWCSVFAFPFGCIVRFYNNRIFVFFRKVFVLICSLFVYGVVVYAVNRFHLSGAIWHQANNIMLIILLMTMLAYIPNNTFKNIVIPKWLNAYYEVYLVHPKIIFILMIAYGFRLSLSLYLIITFVSAVLLHLIDSMRISVKRV